MGLLNDSIYLKVLNFMADNSNSASKSPENFVTNFPVYYGWVIMAVGTLGMIMTSPGQTYTESIFIEYLIEDLAISRSLISTLYSAGTLVGGFSLPFWGKQIDRHGTRKMVTIVALLFGLSVIYMGFIQNALMVGLGFILVRMLGQGSLGLISQTAINQWWVNKRGTIMGISGLLMALLGMGAIPGLVYRLITTFDWRMSYFILGGTVLLIMTPVGYLFFRNRPEDFGLNPDGLEVEINHQDQGFHKQPIGENWTLKEAMRTRTFWIFGSSTALFTLLATGITFHLVSIFQMQGLPPSIAASVFIPIAITAAIINLIGGYLSDRIPLHYLLAFGLFLLAISLLLGLWINNAGTALLFGILFGATNGLIRAVGQVVWPSFFGREHLGSIYGFTSALAIIGAALGPLPFGLAYDFLGSYQPVLLIFIALSVILGVISLTSRKPQKVTEKE